MLILASASPRRRELLSRAGFDFTVCVSECDESVTPGNSPDEVVMSLARKKASAVAVTHRDDTVIGADTIVVLGGKILGKPRDNDDAARMLAALSGKIHTVFTGVCIIKGDSVNTFFEKTLVEFYPLTAEEISEYVSTGEPLDKAGAYGIQDKGCTLVRRIEGDFFNVMGLPVAALTRQLRQML